MIRHQCFQIFCIVTQRRQGSSIQCSLNQTQCCRQHWQRQTPISKNRKHGFLATAYQLLPNSNKVWSSRLIELPKDWITRQSLAQSILIPSFEALFELSSSSYTVRPVDTDTFVRFATSSLESSNRHQTCINVQAIDHFNVNCPSD